MGLRWACPGRCTGSCWRNYLWTLRGRACRPGCFFVDWTLVASETAEVAFCIFQEDCDHQAHLLEIRLSSSNRVEHFCRTGGIYSGSHLDMHYRNQRSTPPQEQHFAASANPSIIMSIAGVIGSAPQRGGVRSPFLPHRRAAQTPSCIHSGRNKSQRPLKFTLPASTSPA